MKNITRISAIFILLIIFSGAKAQSAKDLILPLDQTVKTGVLENGMTYYIKHNEEPKNRASFYMIQNVGAILEEDEQNGLAHFLEHMAFNGSRHFPESDGIINTLEKHGVAFGYNINAYTAQDETVYNLSEVPTNKPGLLDSCLLVLNDWSNYLLLSDEEIDKERGVISEEWRTRRNADFRLYKASMPYIYNESRYAERDVIGDLDVIQNFDYNTLRAYYHKWYRTDLQAIAIVGDFDADEMEQKVIDLFSKIPAVENPVPRPVTLIEDRSDMVVGIVTDEEASQSEISIYIRNHDDDPGIENAGQLRDSYIESLFNRMVSQRISELLQKGEPPFVRGTILRSTLARNYDVTYISTTAKPNQEALALSTILKEVEKVKRYGFTEGELSRAKIHFLNRMENRLKEKDKISNDEFAGEYQSHFIDKYAYMDIEVEFQLMNALFSSISLADFTAVIPGWFGDENRVVLISGPESDDVEHLTETEVRDIFSAVEEMDVEPYEDVEVASSLIEGELEKGSIVSSRELSFLDAEEWTLSNGAKVVYRFADYEKDNIGFKAYSPGGSSLYATDYVPSMSMLPSLIPFYGVAGYDQMTLQKMLTGKTLALNIELGSLSEGMSGNASPKDFEALMQLIYLRFTQPRFDAESHQAIIGRYLGLLENMNKNPQKIMNDSLTRIMTNYHPRTRPMDVEFIGDVDLKKIEEVYKERFSDASDFTFYFVGNIQKEELLPYVEKYIASLPGKHNPEKWVDLNIDEPEGKVLKDIKLSLSVPKSTVVLVFNNEMEYSPKNLVAMNMIQGILDLRFNESIREEEGGTYGVMTDASLGHYPDQKASLMIMFDTDPAKADHLKELIYKELEVLAKEGPSQKDLSKTAENMLKDRDENKEHNSYWLNTLYKYYVHGYDFNDPANYTDIVSSMGAKDIKKLMKKFYSGANVIDLKFSPEEVPAD